MRILTRYIATQLASRFFMVLAAVIGIYLAIDFFQKIDDFLEAGLGAGLAMEFFLLSLPKVIVQVAPVGVLLSCVVVLGIMAKNHETTAYRAGGGDLRGLLRPVLLLGIVASGLLFFFSEVVAPLSARRANHIWDVDVKKEQPRTGRDSDIWIASKNFIGHVVQISAKDRTAYGITLNFFDDRFQLQRRVDAQKGKYENGVWELSNLTDQQFGPNGPEVSHTGALALELGFTDADLTRVARKTDEMTFRQLSQHAQKVAEEGYDATQYKVDLAAKAAFPLVCLIMGVIGSALSLRGAGRGSWGGNLAVNVVLGMGLAFGYWVVYSLCLSLGYAGMLPPIAAAWTANLLFAALAGLLVLGLDG